jgi:hypothetical protein
MAKRNKQVDRSELRSHHRYMVQGQEMYFLCMDPATECLLWYYYIDKKIFYFRDADLKWSEIVKMDGPLTRKTLPGKQVIHTVTHKVMHN